VLQIPSDAPQLVPGEVEAISVQATYVVGLGWSLQIHARRQFQNWSQASHGAYDRLTTAEMVCTVDAALSAELKV
jgi:hypothetical protein